MLLAYFWVMYIGTDSFLFLMNPYSAVNHTVAEFNSLIKPCSNKPCRLGIYCTPDTKCHVV
jgi:hypothetical protein